MLNREHRRTLQPSEIDLVLVGAIAGDFPMFRRVVRATTGLPPFDEPCVVVAGPRLVERVQLNAWRKTHACVAVAEVPEISAHWLISALRAGFDTAVCAPVRPEDLVAITLAEPKPARRDPTPLRHELVGGSTAINDVCAALPSVARSNAPVLITGPSGVGKEIFAWLVHRLSPRRHAPFVALNCAAVPESLLESELFGHEAGAFTDARERRVGRFEQANRGVLFLDEVGEMPLAVQAKLLRVLQEGSFERLGGASSIRSDVRVVAATNRNLEARVRSGEFRADLFYRLCGLSIDIPPLMARQSDILRLWDHFVAKIAEEEGRGVVHTDPAVRRRVVMHDWPGNVRELQNTVRQALVLHQGPTITLDAVPALAAPTALDSGEVRIPGMSMEEIEKIAITKTYEAAGSVRETAEILGLAERTIFARLRRYRDASRSSPVWRPRVVVADDDEALRMLLLDLLGEEFDLHCVADGQAVLLEVERGRPDLIVTDIRMPGLDGLELAEALNRRRLDIPLILMTAYADESMRDHAAAAGAFLIEKPFPMERLAEVMRERTPPRER